MVPLYRSRAPLMALAVVLFGTSCGGGGGDGPTEPGGPKATTVQAVSTQTQEAHVGRAVTEPPSVLVRDQSGNVMAGVTVNFSVTAGNGSVAPASTVTGSDGVASANSWTLGPNTGVNSVTATVSGVIPVAFTATGFQTAASIAAVTATSQEAPAGTAVPEAPGVIVRDVNANPMAGVTVTFAVTLGGGTIVPGTVQTGADGTARTTTWSLGSQPGGNGVSATIPGLPAVPFSANGLGELPAPTTVTAVTVTAQNAQLGQQVSEPPAVIVRDQHNDPMAGVTVSFAVTAGGGTVSPATVVTAVDGVAQLTTWVVGPGLGQNTATATVTGLPVVTFNATGIGCPAPANIPLATTVNGTLGASTCVLSSGEFVELYQFTLAQQTTVRITQTSTQFDTYVLLSTDAGDPVAENDDATGTNSEMFVVLAPGTYGLGASSFDVGETGTFSIRVEEAALEATSCDVFDAFFVMPGVTTAQSLSAADCLSGGFRSDYYLVYLRANEPVTISMNSAQLDAYLALYRDPFVSLAAVAENDDKTAATTDAEIVYTPTLAGYYLIEASSAIAGQTGAYTLVID